MIVKTLLATGVIMASVGCAVDTADQHSQAAARTHADPYTFLAAVGDEPARWSCGADIVVGVNLSHVDEQERASIRADVDAAAAHITALGTHFVRTITDETAWPDSSWGDAVRRGDGASNVAFAVGGTSDLSVSGAAASGGSFYTATGAIYAGYVHVDIDAVDDYRAGDGAMSRVALFTHELLHVLNLGHVDSAESLMTVRISEGAGSIGAGDVAGLQALASYACPMS